MKYTTKTGFYRPQRKRVTEDNLYADPKTGELRTMPSMTKQSFRDQCDINQILKQYKTPAMLAQLLAQGRQGTYADLPDELDYQESMNTIIQAEAAFASLPSKLRNRFDNDPGQFLAFMSDPANKEQWYELGLAVRPADPPPAEPSGREAPPSPPVPPDKA